MANEDKFRDELEDGVYRGKIDGNYDSGLGDKLQELNPDSPIRSWKDRKKEAIDVNVVFDNAYKEYNNEDMQNFVKEADKKDVEKTRSSKLEDIIKSDEKQEKTNLEEKDKELKKPLVEMGYLDRLKLLHEMKMKLEQKRIEDGVIDYNSDLYKNYLLLKKELERERDEYVEKLEDKQKEELTSLENENFKEERSLEKLVIARLQKDMLKFAQCTKELKELKDEKDYINKRLLSGNLTQEEQDELNKKNRIIDEKRVKTIYAINQLNPEELKRQRDQLFKQKAQEREIIGSDLMNKMKDRMPKEMEEAVKYTDDKTKRQLYLLSKEDKYASKKLKQDIDDRKANLSKLIKKYNNTPDKDIEERSILQEQILKENTRIESDEELVENFEKGIQDPVAIKESQDSKEYEVKKIDEMYKGVREDIENVNKEAGIRAAENPLSREEDDNAIIGATAAGLAVEAMSNNPSQVGRQEEGVLAGITTYAIMKEEKEKESDPLNLKNAVYDPSSKEGAKHMLEVDARIKVHKELEIKEDIISKRVGKEVE